MTHITVLAYHLHSARVHTLILRYIWQDEDEDDDDVNVGADDIWTSI